MNFEIKGDFGLKLENKRVLEINAKKEKIILNIRKIGGIKKIFSLISVFSNEDKEEKTINENEEVEGITGKEKINEILSYLKSQGYSVSIKIKGITIIKDLESSSIAKLINFI